ncbi:hypothetical protein F4824DRAFT_504692 [Ustulina deusta]|nr:hypothetical protein F4824DRAFT_504692 [Ustulina deusta]
MARPVLRGAYHAQGQPSGHTVRDTGAKDADGRGETRTSTLCENGDPKKYFAMACLVGTSSVKLVLDGTISDKGILAPLNESINEPLMRVLRENHGIECPEKVVAYEYHVFFVTRTGDSTHRTPLVVMAQGSGFGRLLDVPSHKFEPLTDVFMQGENPEGQSALEDSRDATSSDDTVVVKCRRAVMVTAEAVSH